MLPDDVLAAPTPSETDAKRALIDQSARALGIDAANPFAFAEVEARIEVALAAHRGRFKIISLPNITDVLYGRGVGYRIERIDLDEGLQAISATAIRRKIGDVP